jgi:DNA-directed RNA polymerase subunit M/transcription elongation factor TFIIS
MSEPEIARRCSICGVSIREAALFCPQCGNKLAPRDSNKTQPPVTPVTLQAQEAMPKSAAALSDTAVDSGMEAQKDAQVDFREESQKENQQKPENKPVVKAPGSKAARASVSPTTRGAMGAKIQRAATLARDVEGDVIHRVQKVREISNVVLDEAGDDPSLRFVLVAAFLFLLFLVIVILNRFIT